MSLAGLRRVANLLFLFCGLACAQTTQPLSIQTTSLPKAYVRQPFQARLDARGGTPPYKWEVSDGPLPDGVVLHPDGELSGTPAQTGEFRFTARVEDSSKPAYQLSKQFALSVVSPLMARWGKYPTVNGQRLEGSILVSNETEDDFDLTAIMLAVNDIGRATAIGYQHFSLKKDTDEMEIPFGENLPPGSYQLNVDVVAEIAQTKTIHRVRLVPEQKFQIQQGP